MTREHWTPPEPEGWHPTEHDLAEFAHVVLSWHREVRPVGHGYIMCTCGQRASACMYLRTAVRMLGMPAPWPVVPPRRADVER